MKWRPARIGDKLYDLSHLHPFSFDFVVPPKDGKPEQRYGMDVTFGLHCFTESIFPDGPYVAEMTYADSHETRLFDPDRHARSFQLPVIVRAIGSRRCYHTDRGNFLTIEPAGDEGESEYSIYFKVYRAAVERGLNLHVQSAYPQQRISRPGLRKPVRFSVIAHNIAAGRPIKAPP